MIHYHGTTIGPRKFLVGMSGRNFCVAYKTPGASDLKTCLSIGSSVMLDNGAFSCFTRKLPFDKDGFYRWIEPHLGHPHWAVIPDVIGGSVDEQRKMVKTWPFRKSLGFPVWHLSLPISYLIELCENWERVCFGSSEEYWNVGSDKWCHRMDEAFNALVKTFGSQLPWVHGLRMLAFGNGPWPLASADSTNVGRNFKDGNYCADCMAMKIDSQNPPTRWTEKHIQGSLL